MKQKNHTFKAYCFFTIPGMIQTKAKKNLSLSPFSPCDFADGQRPSPCRCSRDTSFQTSGTNAFLENSETQQTAGLCIHWGLCGNLQSLRLSVSNDSTQICALWPWESGLTLEFRSPSSVQPKQKHWGQSTGINHTFALACFISALFPFSEINFKVSAQSDGFYDGALCESLDFVLICLPPSLPSPSLCSSAAGVRSLLSVHTDSIASSWDFFLLLKVPSLSTLHTSVHIPHTRGSAVLVFLNLISFIKITSISNHFPENNMI